MEAAKVEKAVQALSSSLSIIKWRLKSPARRRLETDVLALCTGMRPVVMIDYGGKMPELQTHLLSLLEVIRKESPIFEDLKVMIIDDMIYLINVRRLAEFINLGLKQEPELVFVDLEQDPPKMIKQSEESSLGMQLTAIQKLFASTFPFDGENYDPLSCKRMNCSVSGKSSIIEPGSSQSSEYVDLSSCMQDTQVTVPTLNGWLLGYPVVYLFGKDRIGDAIYNLSTKSLRIFKILVRRSSSSEKDSPLQELMSFSVPCDLSMGGSKEPWAEAFLARMLSKWKESKHIWKSLEMEVSECYPQAIVL